MPLDFSDQKAGAVPSRSCSEPAIASSTTPSPCAISSPVDPDDWTEVRRWRKEQRARLIAARVAVDDEHQVPTGRLEREGLL